MSNDLVTPEQLSGFPGAPFADAVVDAAVAQLRREAGWHIAPSLAETLTADGTRSCRASFPSLKINSVSAVRDIRPVTPVAITGYRILRDGVLERSVGWPYGLDAIEADVVHGYDECPADLLPVIAVMCQMQKADTGMQQETLGSWSVTLRSELSSGQARVLADYSLPGLA